MPGTQDLPGLTLTSPRWAELTATRAWDPEFLACALAALAAAKGFGGVAEAALELTPEVADEFLEWFYSR